MSQNGVFRPFRDEDRSAHDRMMIQAFGENGEASTAYRRTIGESQIRMLVDDRRPVATVAYLDMAQYFGGRAVDCTAVASVAVDASHRGKGYSTRLMAEALRELRRRGTPLTALYAATEEVYRRVGYERAGQHRVYRLRSHWLPLGDLPPVTMIADGDTAALVPLNARMGALHNGLVARQSALWSILVTPPGKSTEIYVFGEPGTPDQAYLILQRGSMGGPLFVTDYAAPTGAGAKAIVAFLAQQRSTSREVRWRGGPVDPLLSALPHIDVHVEEQEDWMLRVVDVAGALRDRGYPPALTGTLTMVVDDPVLPENTGAYRIALSGGRAEVTPVEGVSGPAVHIGVADLAALYTSHVPARLLAAAGRLSGDPAALDVAELAFAGPPPWMPDRF